ncbi:hypothetical protein jhhlp_000590 [Lomentospora prolificans]|uniref:SWIRM domain-containing protein n=1 Tax=Lomentospora prolificans TaxID=41688 RepID=A0A2N3NIX0_9PEZI|nr:hypothetical protein jhhlp_000590 [Lomentospora prolificans]
MLEASRPPKQPLLSSNLSDPASATTTAAPSSSLSSSLLLPSATMDLSKKKPFDISNLMSPPEPILYDTFSQCDARTPDSAESRAAPVPGPRPPMSPPVSPEVPLHDNINAASPSPAAPTPAATDDGSIKDPILFPPSQDSSPGAPLFGTDHVPEQHRRLVDEHVAYRPPTLFTVAAPPCREDYELALYFKSQVMKNYLTNPMGWLKKERELLVADRKAGARRKERPAPMTKPAKYATILPAKLAASSTPETQSVKAPRTSRQYRVTKAPASSAPRPIRQNQNNGPQIKQTIRVNSTPEPQRRIVAPNREDKDFGALPNYCPPLSSLPNKPNCLKVDWKGAPIDLSNDVNAKLLHPDEIALAANLRLDCATYLTSKRRIFIRRLECARVGKEFRKTDAQQACKIDVNKASKLWTAFEKVGWLDINWVRQFM